jgi:hypothetical protein
LGGGPNPAFDRIVGNTLSGNQPDDVIWDGTGVGNVFDDNRCSTSMPGRIRS